LENSSYVPGAAAPASYDRFSTCRSIDEVSARRAEPRRAVGTVVGHLGVRQIGKFVVRTRGGCRRGRTNGFQPAGSVVLRGCGELVVSFHRVKSSIPPPGARRNSSTDCKGPAPIFLHENPLGIATGRHSRGRRLEERDAEGARRIHLAGGTDLMGRDACVRWRANRRSDDARSPPHVWKTLFEDLPRFSRHEVADVCRSSSCTVRGLGCRRLEGHFPPRRSGTDAESRPAH
jgi:hypothetical protein